MIVAIPVAPEETLAEMRTYADDVMPIGKGNVLIGMSERTSRQAIRARLPRRCSKKVRPSALLSQPKLRAAMHLDTIFTFADGDVGATGVGRDQRDSAQFGPSL
ncbi:hypothetical protein IB248_13825 [Rhizobium sp. RHZ01]|nr:hypothetical protein [Rhizobium sp. RHZ01]